jgi:hypothetical protein
MPNQLRFQIIMSGHLKNQRFVADQVSTTAGMRIRNWEILRSGHIQVVLWDRSWLRILIEPLNSADYTFGGSLSIVGWTIAVETPIVVTIDCWYA